MTRKKDTPPSGSAGDNKSTTSNSDENRFQKHFRKFHGKETSGYPSYVFDKDGNVYKVIGITKGSSTNGVQNILLDKNPEPNNQEKAYLRPKPIKVPTGTKNEKLKGWKFTDSDKVKVQEIIDNAKKKKRKKTDEAPKTEETKEE